MILKPVNMSKYMTTIPFTYHKCLSTALKAYNAKHIHIVVHPFSVALSEQIHNEQRAHVIPFTYLKWVITVFKAYNVKQIHIITHPFYVALSEQIVNKQCATPHYTCNKNYEIPYHLVKWLEYLSGLNTIKKKTKSLNFEWIKTEI